ncbi:FAD-dependent monooxygenase [Aureibacter tunicatorum]|uniref:2-polyprenyl-6-methoxyphenol hydroxylase-like FAD-dependent oxidoreductase n=1 Tax=Aureibacter tunicatorum TaxID=866807 RepID=A0AAE4BR38_9BACT|nr:FAD-dependent monooxygenase [Aureibacter tunicatorum]MDR6238256.1 2-polyprenyl-6-methoxyphenol hydroxylase-like FAD-dependent oxidoreductase [Aureibacter tunicatorum]BDD03289.1 hypothetical protein AUTU_07720 [Aureibacter tunicatorum]
MNTNTTINIVGGGIAGISLAMGLEKSGMEYKLFEKNDSLTYDWVGLGISSNIFQILESWDVLEETKAIGGEIRQFCFVDKKLNDLSIMKISKPPLSVNRKLFYDLLVDKLDQSRIKTGKAIYTDDFDTDDLVVYADGIDSKARKSMHPDLKLRDSGQLLWRGISNVNLDKRFVHSYHDFVGENLRFAIIYSGEGCYSWYLIKEGNVNNLSKADKSDLKEWVKDYHSVIHEVLDNSEGIYFSELKDIAPCHRSKKGWHLGNSLLTGDAIHPMTPNMANGACLAIEGAHVLAGSLSNATDKEFEEIIAGYKQQRSAKVNRVVHQSWYFGKMLHQRNAIMDKMVMNSLRLTPQFMFDKIYSAVLK